MNQQVVVGLLPMYVAMYDESSPQMRPLIEAFYARIVESLEARSICVLTSPVCRIESEFEGAVRSFEAGGASAIVTLHLAYSPSLESERPLRETSLPLIVLDTTPEFVFDYRIDSDAIMYNHGIHGVQDMCNLLRRNYKPFVVCAGHCEHSDVIERVVGSARAASVASALRGMRVGLVGKPFDGMGDFKVSPSRLRADFDIEVVGFDWDKGKKLLDSVSQGEIEREYAEDCEIIDIDNIPRKVYDETERVGLSIRKWTAEENLSAFSVNFQEAGLHDALPTMPFSEASKAMAKGVGYAGEGDVLTAALVGALLGAFPDATFAEMFCPNWEDGSVFLSHMGELNVNTMAPKPHMIVKDFPFAPGFDPCCIMGHYKAGKACYVNLAPRENGYALILCDGEMLPLPQKIGSFENAISGWFKPTCKLEHFLERFSQEGGTHHGAVVYGVTAQQLSINAALLNAELVLI